MAKRPSKPAPGPELAALVKVAQVDGEPPGLLLHLGSFVCPDHSTCRVSATFDRTTIVVARDGHPTRVVKVTDLVMAILEATG